MYKTVNKHIEGHQKCIKLYFSSYKHWWIPGHWLKTALSHPLSLAWTSAPCCSSSRTVLTRLYPAARCNGVDWNNETTDDYSRVTLGTTNCWVQQEGGSFHSFYCCFKDVSIIFKDSYILLVQTYLSDVAAGYELTINDLIVKAKCFFSYN